MFKLDLRDKSVLLKPNLVEYIPQAEVNTHPLLVGAAVIGAATAGAKICVDTIVQEQVDDDYRGRVFSFYDTLFNVTFVAAAVAAAFTLPRTGHSTATVVFLAAGYVTTAAAYALAERRAEQPVSAATAVEPARA